MYNFVGFKSVSSYFGSAFVVLGNRVIILGNRKSVNLTKEPLPGSDSGLSGRI